MLVNVVPRATNVQLAAVVFSVVFEDLDAAPTSSTWTTQLHNLRLDELEVPALVHALDKSTGIICLLEDVTFDLSTNTISCHFVDGSIEQWPLVEERCIEALDKVVQDVNESSLALERRIEEEKQRERDLERRRFQAPLPPLPTKASRHKRQRSLLMTLVASIIPLYSSSNSRLPSPPSTPIKEKKSYPTVSPRDRRRRARSNLVDTFRQYVLSELAQRFPRGGYTTWIIQSMLRRATETMEYLIKEAGSSTSPESGFLYYPDGPEFLSATAELLPSTPSESDDDGETILTDTDGSSVHTPTSLHVRFAPVPVKRHCHVSRSPRRVLSESNYALYTQHGALADRLRRLAILDQERQEQEVKELEQHHRMLEIQGRRRAWLNQTLTGGVRSQHVDLGMSLVFDRSPLALNSWTSEGYEYEPEEPIQSVQQRQEYEEYDKVNLKIKRGQRCAITPKLLPVSEEDGEDVDTAILDSPELEFGFEDFDIDLEEGIPCDDFNKLSDTELELGFPVSFEMERPQLRNRVRTSSMYKHRLHVPPPSGFEPDRSASPQPTASSILQPLSTVGRVSNQDALLQPPVYAEVDVDLDVSQVDISGYGGFDKYAEDEFTLAMDLPVSVRYQDRGVLTNKRRLSFSSDRGWFSSRSSQSSYLGNLLCR